MKKISKILAEKCISVKTAEDKDEKIEESIRKNREAVEALAAKERALIRGADRWRSVAEDREIEQAVSGDSAPVTFLKRTLVPVPKTLDEALLRGAGAITGGAMASGYVDSFGKGSLLPKIFQRRGTFLDPATLKSLVEAQKTVSWGGDTKKTIGSLARIGSVKGIGSLLSFGAKLAENLDPLGLITPRYENKGPALAFENALREAGGLSSFRANRKAGELFSTLSGMTGEELSEVLREGSIMQDIFGGKPYQPPSHVLETQEYVRKLLGKKGISRLRDAIESQRPGVFSAAEESAGRILGRNPVAKIIGGLLGTAVTGIPFAMRAVAERQHGGEAAAEARYYVQKALDAATAARRRREDILARMEGGA